MIRNGPTWNAKDASAKRDKNRAKLDDIRSMQNVATSQRKRRQDHQPSLPKLKFQEKQHD